MYKYKPERNPSQAIALVIGLALLSCVSFGISAVLPSGYKLLAQLVAILILTISVITVIRYTVTEIEYAVTEESFSVYKTVGNKSTMVCSIDIDCIIALLEKKSLKTSSEFMKISHRINYNQNLKAVPFVLVYSINGKRGIIEFEPSIAFANIIKEAIENRKDNNSKRDEKAG